MPSIKTKDNLENIKNSKAITTSKYIKFATEIINDNNTTINESLTSIEKIVSSDKYHNPHINMGYEYMKDFDNISMYGKKIIKVYNMEEDMYKQVTKQDVSDHAKHEIDILHNKVNNHYRKYYKTYCRYLDKLNLTRTK